MAKLLVDSHTHLDDKQFNDLDDVISRAKEAGVKAIIQNGLGKESNRATLEIAKKYDIVKAALGIYPIDGISSVLGKKFSGQRFDVDEEIEFIRKNKGKIVAIGEVGLDNHHVPGFLDEQKKVFEKIVSLSEKIDKPISVHSRDAELETIEFLESSSIKKVHMHCFGGNMKLVKRCAENGWFFSIPTNVVFSQHFQEIVNRVDINQLLTETDAPYLGPVKGERNEPANIKFAVEKISALKGITFEECENNLFMNYQRMFG
jgi:TatD DNase family protein